VKDRKSVEHILLIFGTQFEAFELGAADHVDCTVLEDRSSLHEAYRTVFRILSCEPRFQRSVHLE
jgi:hypothetical protein